MQPTHRAQTPRPPQASATRQRTAERIRLGNREFAGFLVGGVGGGFVGATLDDPVALVFGIVFGSAAGAAGAAIVFGRPRPSRIAGGRS